MNNHILLVSSLNWQDPSKFKVEFHGPGTKTELAIDPDILTASITNLQLADVNVTPVEQYIGEQWRFSTGRLENYQLQLTLKDFNNFELYQKFVKALQVFSREYPKDQYVDIIISTADSFDQENKNKELLTFKNCMLITVSGPTLDNSAVATIAEFGVVFKCSYIENKALDL